MKILLVEDEVQLAKSIVDYLTGESYLCEWAATYAEAMDKVAVYEYDCILLDLMIPGGNGLEVLEALREMGKNDGVIIISAKGALDDKIKGLNLGADDYLPKPFHLSELGARLFSVLRRKRFNQANKVQSGALEIDLWAKTVAVNGEVLILTKMEFDLLLFLVSNKGRVISKAALAEHLSGDMADMLDNHGFVYAHMKNLKRKLADAGCPDYVKTVYGMGYRWSP
ncbi:response regulator transcription factor [Marinilongibacter aquaticus]|uniref:response regulator transcription factor n=1 Tax=Marinilongibacter aquaticus TaxID=2975157 RepID=UPI0021BDC7E1|nr:response regulator transcription factor [Marinilongibacter aquaticus]UBM60740.1 response regulator transcription factor [Marinilongibacter aquaticus]